MTRILRLLLIAAIALPMWQTAAAQDAGVESKDFSGSVLVKTMTSSQLKQLEKILPASEKKGTKRSEQGVGLRSHTETLSGTICRGSYLVNTVPIFGPRYNYTPPYSWNEENRTRSQMIYPEKYLKTVLKEGDQIKSLTFYAPDGIKFGNEAGTNGALTIKLGKCTQSSFTSNAWTSFDGTSVSATVSPKLNDTQFTVTFSGDGFTYTGGPLLVDVTVTTAGSVSDNTMFAVTQTTSYQSRYNFYNYNNNNSVDKYLPTMTIGYDRVVPDYAASIDGNGDFGKVVVNQQGRTTFTVTNTGENAFTPVVTISGNDAQAFEVSTNASGELTPGTSRYYLVTFLPTEYRDYSATLTLTAEESEAAAINYNKPLTGKGGETAELGAGEGEDLETLPVYLYYLNRQQHGQIIYPASILNLTKGTKINKITFHANGVLRAQNTTGANYGSSGSVELKIGETDQSAYSSETFLTTPTGATATMSNIFTGTTEVTFTFSSPYTYNGGNLVIDAEALGSSRTAQSVQWLGEETSSNVGLIQYRTSNNNTQTSLKTFLPWITIDCVPGLIQGRDNELVVTNPEAWKDFTYDWYENGDTGNLKHTSSLDSIATDPDQIIAMLREVYTNKNIPGNKKRGFTEAGLDDHDYKVLYTGVGEISYSNSTAEYYDKFGWNIPADPEHPTDLTKGIFSDSWDSSSDLGTFDYWYMDPEAYMPNQEGVTLLLIEIKDNFKGLSGMQFNATGGYALLREYFDRIIKSARVITNAKRTGKGLESGTLFKIDCDKMNMFYLLAKGQLLWFPDTKSYFSEFYDFFRDPCYVNNSTNELNRYLDYGVNPNYNPYFFLGHMFEQFSPAIGNAEQTRDDIYQDMINMESFGVVHDCPNVPLVQNGHHFMMYGVNEEVADCQDVRDMMFFVPDYRMMNHIERGGSPNSIFEPKDRGQDYFNYNPVIQPTMGLYVIRQKEITPTVAADEYYMLNLNWVTNLDDFLPSDDQEFELLEVVVDEATGAESYVPVYYRNAQGQYKVNVNGSETWVSDTTGLSDKLVPIVLTMNPGKEKNYPDVYVEREEASKQVTYIIRGRDVTIVNGERKHFLSLQYSNKMSYIVPGTDPSELVLLEDATHYSRFDAERIRNAYSNKLEMNNNVDGMKQANLTSSSQMTISRVAQVPTGSTAGVTTDPVTVATVTFNPSTTTYTVQMANQAKDEEEFPLCSDEESRAGYHANSGDNITLDGKGNCSWTGSYTVNNGNIELGSLVFFDNFVQAIPDDNSHPFGYIYNVTTNYPCVSNAVFLNAADYTNGDEIWSAYTWTSENNAWIDGVDLGNGLFKFSPVKPGSNVLFARKDKNNTNTIWNQTADLTFGTNDTYTITGWDNGQNGKMGGYWEQTNSATAHGNTFRIPIYKTSSQINGIFSQTDVEGDLAGVVGKIGNADLPENVEFGVGVSHNSKTEVLRYDTYRWLEGDPRYTVQYADGDDEEDIAPSGQAMNQGESYTITMNGDTNYETNGEVSVAGGSSNIATFVDKYPGLGDDAGAYIYAPIVEAFSGRGEGDYNTYGGPLQSSASGRFDGQRDTGEPPMSSYYWEEGGKRYAYYTIQFSVDRNIKMVPDGYDIYKIRVWRKIDDKSLLKEEYASQVPAIAARMGDDNGTYMYEISYDEEDGQVMYNFEHGASLGSIEMKKLTAPVTGANGSSLNIEYALGTFGAQKLRTNETEAADLAKVIEQLDLTYVVRLYFTRHANLSSAKGAAEGADGKYYIVEQEIPVTLNGGIPTAVENITSREVVGVKYYNIAGIESNTPFDGVNIVVTRYSDGSTSTTKIIK